MNENQLTFSLSKRITELRKDHGYTQEMLANKLGITYQAISKWENELSFPDITLLPTIADIFSVSIDELFGRNIKEQNKSDNGISELPWEDDDTLHAVLFRGKHYLPIKQVSDGVRNEVKFIYEGDALNIHSELSIVCNNSSITGNLTAGANITCCDIDGSVSAGASVNCVDITGDAHAGATINCSDVGQNAKAGCNIYCGDVGGNVKAGSQVTCGDISGDVICQGDIECASKK